MRTRRWARRLGRLLGAAALVAVLPVHHATAEKYGGVEFPQGASSFADAVAAYEPVIKSGQPVPSVRIPTAALGIPNFPAANSYVTLGDGGRITVQFTDNRLTGSGSTALDLWIFEIGPDVEDTFVEVSADGVNWTSVGKVFGATAGINIDAFGFTPASQLSFVRLTDDTNEGDQSGDTVGADIDAIGAISSNAVPSAADDAYGTDEDDTLEVGSPGVLANDSDPNGAVTAQLVSDPVNGTVSLGSDGSFAYVPAADFCGTDTFTYAAKDTQGATDNAVVIITVGCVNDDPTAVDDAFTTDEDTQLVVDTPGVLANDSDVEPGGLSATLAGGPDHGTLALEASGALVYTPDADYCGADGFTYTATDGDGGTDTGEVAVDVVCVNDAPVALADAYVLDEDTVFEQGPAGVLANDSDVDGNPLAATLVSGPAHGTLTLGGDGSFTYVPAADYHGADSFTYQASDGHGGTSTAEVTFAVLNVAEVTRVLAEPTLVRVTAEPGVDLYVVRLVATLQRADTGAPVADRALSFVAGNRTLCTAVSGADGVATCDGLLTNLEATLSLGYDAVFAGDADYVAASGHGPIAVVLGTAIPDDIL